VERVVGHELGQRVRDAVEQVAEVLLGEDIVEDLGQAPVRLDGRRTHTRPGVLFGKGKDGSGSCPARSHEGGIGTLESRTKVPVSLDRVM